MELVWLKNIFREEEKKWNVILYKLNQEYKHVKQIKVVLYQFLKIMNNVDHIYIKNIKIKFIQVHQNLVIKVKINYVCKW